ncbi:Uncharacterised protein [uncultured archaeon]|nr:Uncharacterised protein [uncultured archaeon]
MNENKEHFLDTSVMLARITYWKPEDAHRNSKKYFLDSRYNKSTSIRVVGEAKGVLNSARQVVGKTLQWLYENQSGVSMMHFENWAIRATQNLFEKPHEQKICRSFIQNCGSDIMSAVGSQKTVDEYLGKIRSEIQMGYTDLQILCANNSGCAITRHDDCPVSYSSIYPGEFQTILSTLNHDKDSLIVMDAYFVSNKIRQPTSLITLDREHMLSNKPKIEATLTTVKVCDFGTYLP